MRRNDNGFDPLAILFYILGGISGWFIMSAIDYLLRVSGVLKVTRGGTSGVTELCGDFIRRDRFVRGTDVIEDSVVVVGNIGHGITSFCFYYTAGGRVNQEKLPKERYRK